MKIKENVSLELEITESEAGRVGSEFQESFGGLFNILKKVKNSEEIIAYEITVNQDELDVFLDACKDYIEHIGVHRHQDIAKEFIQKVEHIIVKGE